mgnify:CR=1 FL=1
MSETPRTDRVCCGLPPHGLTALIDALDFARQLERELNVTIAEIAKLKQERDEITAILNEWEEALNTAKAGRKE